MVSTGEQDILLGVLALPIPVIFGMHTAPMAWMRSIKRFGMRLFVQWLQKLGQHNHRFKVSPEPVFSGILAERWFFVCSAAAELELSAWPILWKPPRSKYVDLTVRRRLRLLVQCVINQIVQGYEAIRSVKRPNA